LTHDHAAHRARTGQEPVTGCAHSQRRVDAETLSVAARIVDDVRARGDEALRDYTRQFDKAEVGDLRVSRAEIETAVEVFRRISRTR